MNNRVNAMASGHMMQDLYKRYGSWSAALTAYNTGSPTGTPTAAYRQLISSLGSQGVGGGQLVNLPVSHPNHPHNQKSAQPPVVNIGNITVEIMMPDGTVEKLRGKAKFDGVAGIHVKSTMPHHGNAIVHPANTRRSR